MCEVFFMLVVESYILYTIIMSAFGMDSLEDSPSNPTFGNFSTEQCDKILLKNVRSVIDNILTSVMGHQMTVYYLMLKKCFHWGFS